MYFCNINFNILHKDKLFVLPPIQNIPKFIITVNAEFISFANNNKRFMEILNTNYTTFDGMVPFRKAQRILKKYDFEKISGSDMVYDFCIYAQKNNLKIFLFGGDEAKNDLAVRKLRQKYSISITGYSPPFESYPFSENFNKTALDKITEYHPDILFVGLGMPKQEYWIDDNKKILKEIGIKYVIGCGGTINFCSDQIKRAPTFIQNIGLEFVYRFLQEPDLSRLVRIINAAKYKKYIYKKPDF